MIGAISTWHQFTWLEVLRSLADITVVALITYQGLKLVRGTRAASVIIGLSIVLGVYLAARSFGLATTTWILEVFFGSVIVLVVVLFQDEIRRALMQVGTRPLRGRSAVRAFVEKIDEVVSTAMALQEKKLGALLVFQRDIGLEDYVETGTIIDGVASQALLLSLFSKDSVLHDGAVILYSGVVRSAGSMLPLSQRSDLDISLGTRHRAALGLTERSDAVVVVVSEESGKISLAYEGKLLRDLQSETLRDSLVTLLVRREEL